MPKGDISMWYPQTARECPHPHGIRWKGRCYPNQCPNLGSSPVNTKRDPGGAGWAARRPSGRSIGHAHARRTRRWTIDPCWPLRRGNPLRCGVPWSSCGRGSHTAKSPLPSHNQLVRNKVPPRRGGVIVALALKSLLGRRYFTPPNRIVAVPTTTLFCVL